MREQPYPNAALGRFAPPPTQAGQATTGECAAARLRSVDDETNRAYDLVTHATQIRENLRHVLCNLRGPTPEGKGEASAPIASGTLPRLIANHSALADVLCEISRDLGELSVTLGGEG